MIEKIGSQLGGVGGVGSAGAAPKAGAAGESSFADMLKESISEVTRLQSDASKAVENLVTGKTEDVSGVTIAMEKSDLAFKTLLAIRGKLMDAYEEIKQIAI